jgi:hypothetical protein
MALTADEKRRVMEMLDQMDRSRAQRVLDSVKSFGNWLYGSLYSIYCKVKDAISSLWGWLRSIFN